MYLVAVEPKSRPGPENGRWKTDASLEELGLLAKTAGAEVVGSTKQRLDYVQPATYIGKGKISEIVADQPELGYTTVIFDDELRPSQQRNLETDLKAKVVDRTALILDIFAQHAHTREGRLQVELAQHEYILPRLRGQWSHLERLGGGIGTRGPGETQLESDRRIIQRRVMKIRRDLEGVQVHRRLQRQGRRRNGVPVVALVGYTNAGKTTLMNRLTGASLHAADQLFVTLDPAARRVSEHVRTPFILTDTVGFIRKLPHELVAAFRATLEELTEADLLLHVVDASQSAIDDQLAAVESLLEELGVAERPTILVLNKIDRVASDRSLDTLITSRPRVVAMSAATGRGLEGLLAAVESALAPASPAVVGRHAAEIAVD